MIALGRGPCRVGPQKPVCWCGWFPAYPRHFFASHLVWHLSMVDRRRALDEVLG